MNICDDIERRFSCIYVELLEYEPMYIFIREGDTLTYIKYQGRLI